MRFPSTLALAFSAGLMMPAAAPAADRGEVRIAQIFSRPQPPADVDDPGPQRGPDAGALVIRIERLESQIRSMTGQIEQLQFQVRRLEEQGRGAAGGQPGPAAQAMPQQQTVQPTVAPALPPPVPVGGGQTATPVIANEPPRARRGDAFDPAADPGAPGAPRQIGTTTPSAPLTREPTGPLNAARTALPSQSMQPMDLGQPRPPATAGVERTPEGTQIASTQPQGPKEEYELAAAFLKQGQYEDAEKSFSAFIAKNPRNRYTADAIFGLGESYYQRGRIREAAEQYLKISTNYATSAKGAESLLRLGQSLNALGAKEQACASFAEVSRKHPTAASAIRAAEREAKKDSC
ncbi:MAG: tol-pal system protein YbgF [Hyphomicrobiales bacterium]|nr:tol-pal system protein YbgF [Hyphomicrobiales bacterium]